jgi:PDZ domain-containing protein
LKRHITPWRVLGALLGAIACLLLITVVILMRIPSGQYLLLVDGAHPVAPLVRVQGAKPVKSGEGKLYFVDVREQNWSEFNSLFSRIPPHASFVPAGDIVAPCSTDAQANAAALQQMAFSQQVAAAVALRKLHYHVGVTPTGVVVSQLIGGTHAPCNLQPMDIIVAVNGTPTPTVASLEAVLGRVTPGAVVRLRIRRDGKLLTVPIKTVVNPRTDGALVGFAPGQSATFKLPRKVTIDANGIGGPSAGLAFTLEVMQQLGRNVLHGHKVAATGEMELNGAVGPIGGIKQKTYGVRQAGADVFLVPAGQNARDARKYAGPVRIIPVRSLDQALHALATLPPAS